MLSHKLPFLGAYDEYGNAVSGLMYYLDLIYSPWNWFPPLVDPNIAGWQVAVRVAANISLMIAGAIIIALLCALYLILAVSIVYGVYEEMASVQVR